MSKKKRGDVQQTNAGGREGTAEVVGPSRLQFWLAVAAIWAAAFLAYSNSFTIAFQFDDTHTVQSNMYVRSLRYIPQYFVDAKTFSYRPENSGYRPMTTTALALGFSLSRMDTWGYHLIKLLEHCLVATLVFIFGLRLLPRGGGAAPYRFWVAFLAGLVFVVHRALTETVDYISAISTLQAGLFHVTGFYLWLKWRETAEPDKVKRFTFFGLALLSYMCSMWSKEEGITLPAMILLYEWICRRRDDETHLARLKSNFLGWALVILPFVLTAVLFVILRTLFQPAIADSSRGNVPVFDYFITQFRSWLHYLKLFFFPITLNADNLAFEFSTSLDDLRVWGALVVHLLIWGLTWYVGRKRRFVLFAVAWFYVTVLPASSFFPLVEAVNEHRFYIPYVFLSLVAVWAVFELFARLKLDRRIAIGFVSLCALVLAIGAHARNEIWQTDVSLWEDVYSKNPGSPRAMNVLGVSLLNRGDFTRSVPMLEECHRIAPNYLPCIVHLSIAYGHFKNYDKGLEILKFGNRVDPNYVHVNFHLGMYYKEFFADFNAARYYFQKVEELTSGRFFQATLKLAEMEMEEGRVEQAMALGRKVLELDQSNGDAWDVYGKAYMLKNDSGLASQVFTKLYQSAPESVRYELNVANLAERHRDFRTALNFYQQVVQHDPELIQGWTAIGRVALALGDANLVQSAQAKVAALKQSKTWHYIPSMFLPGEKPRQIAPE